MSFFFIKVVFKVIGSRSTRTHLKLCGAGDSNLGYAANQSITGCHTNRELLEHCCIHAKNKRSGSKSKSAFNPILEDYTK